MIRFSFAIAGSLALLACADFDGGLEPVGKLPAPRPADTSDTSDVSPDGDAAGEIALSFVRPSAAAEVDGDWIEVELALSGATLGEGLAIALSARDAAGTPLRSVTLEAQSGVITAPAGAITLRAELVAAGAPLDPPVVAEVQVGVSRVTPTLAFAAPSDGAILAPEEPIAWELTLTDFTLLAEGATPTGPRQGRLALVLDGASAGVVDQSAGSLPAQAEGPHTLTVTLLDAAGAPWDPPVVAAVAFTVGPPPAVVITAPLDGAEVQGSRLRVAIAAERFVLDGEDLPGHGTWRLHLDEVEVASRLTGDSATITGLAAGAHTLAVELTDAAGAPLSPPVTDTVTFTSVLPPPHLDIVLPTSARVAEGRVRIAVLPHFFTFSATPLPAPLVPATGGWQLLVDGAIVADRLTTAQTEVVLTPGTRVVTARLVDNAGQALSPPAEATRTLEVVAVETSVTIVSPADGATVPLRFPVAVAFEDFTLTSNVLAPDDDPVPGQGHFHAFLRKQGTSQFVYQGFYLTETFELVAGSAGTWDVLVALHYENHSPVLPPVEHMITVEVDDRPTIHIASPQDGGRVGRDPFAVAVQIDNFELIPLGEVSNIKGHYHLFIDAVYQNFFVDPVAIIDPAQTLPAPLSPGAHRLEAFLHRSDHSPVDGALGHIIDFSYDPTPRVAILAPASGRRVTTGPFALSFELDNLTLVDKAGEAAVPGEGHVHVFVDNVYQGFETRSTFPLTIPTPGPHTVKLTLHENDHSAIADAEPAFVEVFVDATPRVRIVTPEDMGFAYADDLEVRLLAENMPADGLVEVWLDEVLFWEGAPGAPISVPRPAEGEHTIFTVPLDAEGRPLAGGEVVTARFEMLGLAPPTITFVAPLPNATLAPGATVTVGTSGFSLEGGLGRAPAVPGDGMWTLTAVAGQARWTFGPYTTPTVPLPAVPRGATRLIAELWHRDGSRVVPTPVAEVPVQIAAGPRISLVSPLPDQMVYGPDLHIAVDLSEGPLGPGAGWIAVEVDGRPAAYLTRTHGVIGPFSPGVHVLGLELLDADRAPYDPPVRVSSRFRVGGESEPALTIDAPADGATLPAGAPEVRFSVGGIALDPIGLRGPAQAGRGAVLVLVDGRVRAVATQSPVRLPELGAGEHLIELVLVGLDLVPIAPATRAAVLITIED